MTPQLLAAEINGDPTGLGLAAFVASGNDQGITNALNLVRAAISVKRTDCSPADILEAIDRADFAANPNAVLVSYFESATQQASLRLVAEDGTDTRILSNIKGLLTASTASRTRLNAVAVRTGSRAEQLWGAGASVTNEQVANALGRG